MSTLDNHGTEERKAPAEEVYDGIFRIAVVLPGNPLRATNAYFIRGTDWDLLIDTGFRRKECFDALKDGLDYLGSDQKRRRVLCTHLHADHSGMADLFAGQGQKIYMGRTDRNYRVQIGDPVREQRIKNRYYRDGFPMDVMNEIYAKGPAFAQALPNAIELRDSRFTTLEDGEELNVGGRVLKTVLVPGHTPGNCMFWMEREKVMFTGDHILFDITPNITEWDGMEDSLGDYIDSLRNSARFPVQTALPGHRASGNYGERIGVLIGHHRKRLEETISILTENPGISGYDAAGKMKWKIRSHSWEDFPNSQKWFAVGECLAHLNYLIKRGKVVRETDAKGFYHYSMV